MPSARRPAMRAAVGLLALVALAPVLGEGSASAVAAVPASFSFAGSGWGHGVGMSQYGARGMAADGYSAAQIVKHYYAGTTLAPLVDSMNVRVNLLHRVPSVVFRSEALVAGGGGIEVAVTGSAPVLGTPADVWTVVPGTGAVTLRRTRAGVTTVIGTGTYVVVRWAGTRYPGRAGAAATVLNVARSTAGLATAGHRYRYGWVDIGTTSASPASFEVVNSVRLHDEYLLGLGEMPSSWPAAALQAQVLAARSYALARFGAGTVRSTCRCHVDSGHGPYYDQSFIGWAKEASTAGASWRAAVFATRATPTTGRAIVSGGRPVTAFYFSASGGRTQSSQDVWGGTLPYAQSVDDHWSMAASVPWSSWTPRVRTQAQVAAALGLANVASLDLRTRTDGGGVRYAVGYSASGASATITGEQLRARLGLPSTWITGVTDTATGSPVALVPGSPPPPPPVPSTNGTGGTAAVVRRPAYPGKPFGHGAVGSYVTEVQRHLGYTRGFGYFSAVTVRRVRAAQVRAGLPATGVVDWRTWFLITRHR